jgi:hypothetical protein
MPARGRNALTTATIRTQRLAVRLIAKDPAALGDFHGICAWSGELCSMAATGLGKAAETLAFLAD